MAGLVEITSQALTPKEASRLQLLSRSALHISPGQLRERFFGGYSMGQISSALDWDLQLRSKPLKVRVRLCADFLCEHPSDPVSSDTICRHFGLSGAEFLSALAFRERHAPNGGARLSPVYPGTNWNKAQHDLDPGLHLDGAYWHSLEVLHLHVIARRKLRPEGILDRRIFPGVALADIEHHLNKVRLPPPEALRRHGGQLTPSARRLLLQYLRYCQETRQFVTLAAVRELFGISANAMSRLSAEAGWSKASYYEFRRKAYRGLVGRYTLRFEKAIGVRPSLILVCRHAEKVWRFPAQMIRLNLAPELEVGIIEELRQVPLPLPRRFGGNSAFDWYEKIPGRKLLYDVLIEQFGVIPRWELARAFMLTGGSFAELLAHERIDPAEWDRAHTKKKASWVFCLPGLTPAESLDCIHTQILAQDGIDPAAASQLGLLDVPGTILKEYRKTSMGFDRSSIDAAARSSMQLDPLTCVALRNYLGRYSAVASQEQVMRRFGVDRTCLNRLRRSLAAEDGPAYNHWGRTRLLKVASHFDGLGLLLGLGWDEAVSLLHLAVTGRAVCARTATIITALWPGISARAKEELAMSYEEFPSRLAPANQLELAALVRAYFKQHPGVPLRPVSEVTGLTERRLEALLPRQESGVRLRRAEWTALFADSNDARIWGDLRAHFKPRH